MIRKIMNTCFLISFLMCNNFAQDKFTVPLNQEIDFKDNEEFLIRTYLVEKYNPDNCFGMPSISIYPERKVNKDLIVRIKERFNLTHDSEAERIARKMARIGLMKESENEYYFEFSDGRCCDITKYKGRIKLVINKIIEELIEKESKNVPC